MPDSSKTFCVKRRSVEEILCATGLLSFVLGFCVQYWTDTGALLILSVVGLSTVTALSYIQSIDFIQLRCDGTLVLRQGFMLYRSRLEIPLQDVEFVGIGGPEKFPRIGHGHVVYIQHRQKITPIRNFKAGRDAVVMAKSLKQFIDK